MQSIKQVRYIGQGQFLMGTPARDMSAEEWQALTAERRAIAESSGLYVIDHEQGPEEPAQPKEND